MVCGGNALGGLWVGMCRVVLPDSHLMEAPVWLPHAMIARGQRLSPDPSASYDSWSKGQNISPLDGQPQHCSLTRHPQGPYEAEGCERVAYRDQRWKERSGTEDDIVSTALDGNRFGVWWFTFSKRNDGEAKCSQLMLGGSSLRLSPLGFLSAGPAVIFLMISLFCRKSLSPGGNAPLPAWGNPTLGQPDAETRCVCSHITRDQHTLSSCLCFFAFFLPLSTQSSVSPFLWELPLVPGGF